MEDTHDSTDISDLAREVVAELKPGTTIADKVILSRRQLVAIAGGSVSVGALMKFGVSEAQAQEAAGAVGTESDPIDVFAASINDGGPVTDGDGTERRIWLIEADAGDPDGATAEDLIFEEEDD